MKMRRISVILFLVTAFFVSIFVSCDGDVNQILFPTINVYDSSNTLLSNGTGVFDFGNVPENQSITETFTIKNTGNAVLELTGSPKVSISGSYAIYSMSSPSTSIAVGKSTTFTLKYHPTSIGVTNATVTIRNNDIRAAIYTFKITAVSHKLDFDFNGDGFDDVLVGANLDDEGGTNSGCAYIFFGSANPTTSINASNADVKLIGKNAGDKFGYSVSSAGDVNNDGFVDVIVGAPDLNKLTGCAYIFFGSANPASSIDAANADVTLNGESFYDLFGSSVSSAGDVNDDGFVDVIVGAWGESSAGDYSGSAYIFFGSATMGTMLHAMNADVKLVGENKGDRFGCSVSTAGDLNKDGFDDVIVGARESDKGGSNSGAAFIFIGRSNWQSSISAAAANVRISGESSFDKFGYSVSNAGDINDDGFDDAIVGAPSANAGGMAYIFYGTYMMSAIIDASNADVKLQSNSKGSEFGCSVSSAGDFDGDGNDDVIVGARYDNIGGDASGSGYIFFGRSNMAATIDDFQADVKLAGGYSSDNYGNSVSCAGDVNNDGLYDVIVGANTDDDGGTDSGCAFIIYGRIVMGTTTITTSNANVKLVGGAAGVQFGCSVSGGK